MLVEINGKKILFIHIPKTGGSSIERFLGLSLRWPSFDEKLIWGSKNGMAYQHLTAKEIVELTGHKISEMDLVFAVIRDPIDRFISACNYNRLDIKKTINHIKTDNLGKFIRKHFIPQYRFIEDYSKEVILVDFKQIASIPHLLGLKGELGHQNVSKKKLTRSDLDSDDLLFLKNYYKQDFILYEEVKKAKL